jgi:hypothetical protein
MLAKKDETVVFWQIVLCSISRRYEIAAQIPTTVRISIIA